MLCEVYSLPCCAVLLWSAPCRAGRSFVRAYDKESAPRNGRGEHVVGCGSGVADWPVIGMDGIVRSSCRCVIFGVLYSMVECGIVWLVWYRLVLYCMVQYGIVWCGMVWYGVVWYGMVWYGMVWCGMVWYDMVWYGMVWYGMVWYSMV